MCVDFVSFIVFRGARKWGVLPTLFDVLSSPANGFLFGPVAASESIIMVLSQKCSTRI